MTFERSWASRYEWITEVKLSWYTFSVTEQYVGNISLLPSLVSIKFGHKSEGMGVSGGGTVVSEHKIWIINEQKYRVNLYDAHTRSGCFQGISSTFLIIIIVKGPKYLCIFFKFFLTVFYVYLVYKEIDAILFFPTQTNNHFRNNCRSEDFII